MPRRLVRRVVPALATGHAVERAQKRPRLALVAALEDARRLDAGEQAPVRGGQPRDLRQLRRRVPFTEADALARGLPRLAEVAAAPDGGPVPLARGGGIHVAALRVVDRVVDGPALAVGAPHLPVAAVTVALQDEAPFPGSDEDDRLRHLLHLRVDSTSIPLGPCRAAELIGQARSNVAAAPIPRAYAQTRSRFSQPRRRIPTPTNS